MEVYEKVGLLQKLKLGFSPEYLTCIGMDAVLEEKEQCGISL
jgi:hypothetical protein